MSAADPEKALGFNQAKYSVRRSDGSSDHGGKHGKCVFFVLDLEHDKYARPALEAYADWCESEYPPLAADIRKMLKAKFPRAGACARSGPARTKAPRPRPRAPLFP